MLKIDGSPLEGQPYFDPEKSWVPPMNFEPSFRRRLDLRGPFYVYDVTLRDGEQTPGVALSFDEKVMLAEELDALGVEAIELGIPMLEKDFAVIRALAKRDLRAKVGCLVRARRADIELAVEAGAELVCVEHTINPYSCKLAYDLDEAQLIARNVEACAYAKEQGLIVNWMGWDAFRQPREYIERVFKAVVGQGGPDRVTIADTFGMSHPLATYEFFREFRTWFPDKLLELHCHNDFGMATANAIAAMTGGANSAHTAVNGLGERAGNIALEELAVAAQVAMGINLGIDLSRLSRLSKLAVQFSRFPCAPNKPVVGTNLFNVDSGMIIHIFEAAERAGFPPLVMLPYLPEVVGRRDFRFVYGKGAGGAALDRFLRDLGVEASEEQRREILQRLKREAGLRKAFLEEDELRHIVLSVVEPSASEGKQ
jgi:isopropylmalate/homocitrate/citramalate synthase